jgi:ornithine cyclodeaminase/alanine dehydrogenase-like protein (mu-crystallin family)
LATVVLYPPASCEFKRLVTFGAGSQIRSHIDQLVATYPSIVHITVVNRTINDRVITLLDRLREDHPAAQFMAISKTDGGTQVESAVRQADLVCCATGSTAPLFPSEWVRPGTHVILVGSFKREMAEVDTALIRRARKILVDSRSACAIEAGELIAAGVKPEDVVEVGELLLYRSELWQVDTTRVSELLTGSDVTIFKSVGLGGQDVAISVATVDRAIEMEIGTRIPNFE